ncbi:MAG: LPD7 domain-containing protein [Acidithiobacillus caldus]|uniref:Large polyvalent protein-associated domain-containing protein n=1 Tax=Acidithiobacillus caldus TaxID=33059 RepID=A0A1E7YQF4_9PROT|nr:LPD7 domain-containing protein [Acidithiobacillus caldus]OFC35256.1 hypothetical protein BAE29_16110 [Acidithiobacillus caldus]OFC38571.1 hypothetical protein BAE27_01880 [Acidithiobacillus caldus]OFC39729.1 hypothetical protein BAE28_02625 [Acidithiobacillus caldus]WMT47175.1 MAG: LPD7 domain-containing protein [Acidithiobacillus caldus]
MGRWYRIERRADALVLSNREASVTDFGDRVVAQEGNDKEIQAMVRLAQAKGWSEVELTGSEEFQERAAIAFLQTGISLADKDLESRVLASTKTQDEEASLPFQLDLHPNAVEPDIEIRETIRS